MDKRYLVLTELFLPTKGGTAVWFDEVYRRLGGKGIHVVTADVPGAREHDRDHPNTIHRLNLRRVPWLRPESLGMYAKFFAKALSLAVFHRFDAIHAGRALPEGLVAWCAARLTGHRVATYAHGEELTGWGRGNKYRAMRFALTHADVVIANSEFTQTVLQGMGVRGERIRLIHPGVDIERFRPGLPSADLRERLGIAPDERLILSVGRLSRRKGFDTLIQCLSRIGDAGRKVHYAIIGIGEDAAYLHDMAVRCGVRDRVHLLGHVSMDELPRWYNACDLFVLVNRDIEGDTEGFGIVFLEAAACGKVSIAGNAGGTGAAVLDGITGLRVDGCDGDAVVKACRHVLGDAELVGTLGANALARVRGELNWAAVATRIDGIAMVKADAG